MENIGTPGKYGLENYGIKNVGKVYWNPISAVLVEEALKRNEGVLSPDGALIVNTGKYTGRSPNDRFVVDNGTEEEKKIDWGKVNVKISPENFDKLYAKMLGYLQNRDVFVADLMAGADPVYRLPIRIISEFAWTNLFANNMFIRPALEDRVDQVPGFTVICVPGVEGIPETDGTNSAAFIVVNFAKKIVLIGGSRYGGEVKKSVFSVMNFILPLKGVMTMHCSANLGKDTGDTALFFGLSGTGKTTLSSDPNRLLIGDDEHGWSDTGIFNFEGGCYAKMIKLNHEHEPLIWDAVHNFGAVLENVVYDETTRELDFDSDALTENTRGAYPIYYIDGIVEDGIGVHPTNIFMLTADAFGVLPPLSKLDKNQAMYYFMSGYTSKLAGTERGITEPQPNFSACFGSPFLPLHPSVYADLLGERIAKHNSKVWLVNTGWSGGPYGVGSRFKLPYTRAFVTAALDGSLNDVEFVKEPFFGLSIPKSCPGVPDEVLNPRETWKDKAAYDEAAKKLAASFVANFKKYEEKTAKEICEAGPKA
ncbi:MAG: phosphoenolpyruvate carboxykinase (ATP) [Chloroflexi bacterium]|jgi:phosphoenolpyruvate carboxykinase (ATP)|nr:phosphoenolpyruvate carboxykinase (ATP) [Chloroflexota bacterium]